MEENNNKGKFWSVLGKIALVVTILIGLLEFYKYIFSKDLELELSIDHSLITYQLNIKDTVKKIENNINGLENGLYDLSLELHNKKLDSIIRTISSTEHSLNNLEYNLSPEYTLWNIFVENTGKKEGKDIDLEIPLKGYCRIMHDNRDTSFYFKNIIQLGTIRPSNKYSIRIWSEGNYGMYHSDEIKLISSDGVYMGATYEKYIGFRSWIANHVYLIIFLLFFVIGSFFLYAPVKIKISSNN